MALAVAQTTAEISPYVSMASTAMQYLVKTRAESRATQELERWQSAAAEDFQHGYNKRRLFKLCQVGR